MPRAGELKDRYRFEQRAMDDNGDRLGAWTPGPTVSAQTTFLKGGEGVLEQRLQGSQPVIIAVRASSQTKPIDNAWRAVDARDDSRVFDISGVNITADRAFLEILATQKVGQTNG